LAEKLAGHSLDKTSKTIATQVFHWTTGSLVGAVYGGVAEVAPVVTAGYGVGFGIAVLLLTHESALPLLGLDKPPTQQPFREQSSEVATHAFYGFAVEAVRRWLRKRSGTNTSPA
jgi:putative membrane protein